jgi:uncharacterized metal-binding protein YceD (DUF177 family)
VSNSELVRMIRVRPLPGEVIGIEANETERAALAARFGLSEIESLRAQVTLEALPRAIRATGRLAAAIIQPCAISAEDFPIRINEQLDLRFVEGTAKPRGDEDEFEIELVADDCDEIEYAGEMFDLGEAVAQSLGLAIDPYAEGPNADAARRAAGIIKEGEQLGPLAAALAGLKKD